MANVLNEEKKQEVSAPGRAEMVTAVQQATHIRRETARQYLKSAGIAVQFSTGMWSRKKSRLRRACLAWKLILNYFRKRRRAMAIAPIKPEPRSNKDDGSGAELNENPASPFGPKLPIWKVSLTVPSDSNIAKVITPLKFHTKPGAFQLPIGSGGCPFSQTPFAQAGNTQMFAPANGGFVQPGQAVQPAPPTQTESKATWSLVSAPCPHGSNGDSPSLARNMVVPPTGS